MKTEPQRTGGFIGPFHPSHLEHLARPHSGRTRREPRSLGGSIPFPILLILNILLKLWRWI